MMTPFTHQTSSKSRRHRVSHDELIIRFEALLSCQLCYSKGNPLPFFPMPIISTSLNSRLPKTHPKQIPHPLIQPGRKNAVHVEKDRVGGAAVELLAQEIHHRLELHRGGDLEDERAEDGGRADGFEAYGYCWVGKRSVGGGLVGGI
jgi:hypothetical protein